MLNDENKRGCLLSTSFFEYRRYFLYSLWLLILIIKLPSLEVVAYKPIIAPVNPPATLVERISPETVPPTVW